MISDSDIAKGNLRLTANKLSANDRAILLGAFQLYLKADAVNFPDLSERLANLTDNNESQIAAMLAAVVIAIKESGFGVAEMSGGRSGLKYKQQDKLAMQLRFALTLLGYVLPESFSGSVDGTPSDDGLDDYYSGGSGTGSSRIISGW